MKQSRAAIRYAKALLQLSIEQDSLDQSYIDMTLIKSICVESKDLSLLLKSPIVKTDKKLKILKEVFESKVGKLSMLFINTITNKKREVLLAGIASSFISLYKTHNNIESVKVTTAIPLTTELKSEVSSYIKKYGDKDVELTEEVDKSIIGGVIIRMGDKQIDASLSNEISELRQVFNKNLYLQDF